MHICNVYNIIITILLVGTTLVIVFEHLFYIRRIPIFKNFFYFEAKISISEEGTFKFIYFD